jgi:cob(I)alamin adenosyltransferase
MPIYTKTGDTGETSLFGGVRVLKCDELVDVYGSIDELNCWIGLVTTQITDADTKNFLKDIQSDLFTIGSTMAGWKCDLKNLSVCAEDMEVRIDIMEEKLPKLSNFILPGGTVTASWTHVARAVCRRVERQVVGLYRKSRIENRESTITDLQWNVIIKYLNRLSDLLFDMSRFINNDAGVEDVIWSGIPRTGKKLKVRRKKVMRKM